MLESPFNAQPIVISSTVLDVDNTVALGTQAVATADESVAIGNQSRSNGRAAVAIGNNAVADIDGAVALGGGSVANTAAGVSGYVPSSASTAQAAAIAATTSTLAAVSVGDAANGQFRQITGVAAGTADSDAVNVAQLKAVSEAAEAGAVHYYSVNDGGTASGNYNNDGATGTNSMAAGINAIAEGANSLSMGNGNQVQGASSIRSAAIGAANIVNASANSIALGVDNAVTRGSTAVGVLGGFNTVTGVQRTAIVGVNNTVTDSEDSGVIGGTNTMVESQDSVQIGNENRMARSQAVAQIGGMNVANASMASSMIGIGNQLSQSNSSSIIGIANTVANTAEANATGVRNTIDGGSQNSVIGSNNTLVNGQQNFVAGFGNTLGRGLTGNQILASGATVAAGTSGAVVVGMGGTVSANNAVAIGTKATVTEENGVALGSNSVANTAAGVAGYVPSSASTAQAAAIAATTSTLAAVSVGDAANGQFRQITGVAAGTEDSDAVNVSQLKSLAANVETLSDDALLWDPTANGGTGAYSANHGGTGPNKITNVANGDVTATSTDAINGSQLFAIAGDTSNTYVTNNGAGVKYVRTNDTGLAPEDAHASGQGSTAVGYNAQASASDSLALGRGSVASNDGAVALGSGSVTAAAVATTSTEINGKTYNFAGTAPTSTVSVGDVGEERTITNVAAGRLSATSTDAVNGSQLFATNTAIDALNTTVTNLGNDALLWDPTANGGTGAYSANHGGTGPNKITNVANGDISATSTDAINGSQLFAATTAAAAEVAAGTNVKDVVKTTATDGHTIYTVNANGTTVSAGSAAVSVTPAAPDANNVTDYAVDLSAATKTKLDNAVQYDDNTHTSVTLDGAGGTVINNVAAGEISANSSQAVNGSQLYQVQQSFFNQQNQINSNRKLAGAGIAGAIAQGSIRYDDRPGKFSMGIGVGTFDSQAAMAIGAGYTSKSQLWRFSVGASMSPTTSKAGGFGASASYTFN